MSETADHDPIGRHVLNVVAAAKGFNHWTYETIKPHLKGNVLEIGSGIGNISDFLIEDGFPITLSDYSPDYCSYLQKKYGAVANVKSIVSIDLLNAEFEKSYKEFEEQFDTVFLLNVLEHIADPQQAIINCKHLIKKNGNLIILVPAYQWLYSNFDRQLNHYKRYSSKALQTLLLANDLKIRKVQYFNALGIPGWLLYSKLLGRQKIENTEMKIFDSIVSIGKAVDRLLKNRVGLSVIAVAQKS